MGAFWANFNDVNDMFGSDFEATTSFDPFEADQSDTDRSGLSNDIDDLDENAPFEEDEDIEEVTEDLDTDDIEPGEGVDEDQLNEVDLDFDIDDEGADVEPDWNPNDQMKAEQEGDATDSSEEKEAETMDSEIDDNTMDEWEDISQDEETSVWNEVLEDDTISQLEETGIQEPLYYDEEADLTDDPTNEAAEDIEYVDHRDDITDDITDEIEGDRDVLESGAWVDSLEDFLDFTEQDVSSFHDNVSDGYQMPDGYDPPHFPDEGVDLLELGNFVDDVFADIFPDPINDPFAWYDSFE